MADNKKYYYLKLNENFFNSEDMKLLQGMKDGYMYSDLLLKLCLQSLRQGGRLMYRDIIPYTPEMIATVTGHQIGTVEKAIKIFEEMKFVEILDNGAIYMMDIQNFIGQSSSEADRRRNYRKMIDTEKSMLLVDNNVTNVTTNVMTNDGQMSDKSTPEYRDKSIEYRDIDNINTFAQSSANQTSEPAAEPFITLQLNTGDEHPVYDKEIKDWEELYPAVDVRQQLRSMKGWLLSNPTKRKTKRGINRFINNWLSREQDRGGSHWKKSGSMENKPGMEHQKRIAELAKEDAVYPENHHLPEVKY